MRRTEKQAATTLLFTAVVALTAASSAVRADVIGDWVADDLATGAATNWTDRVNSVVASVHGAPTVATSSTFNNHNAVNFAGSDFFTTLANNLAQPTGDFSISVVFATSTPQGGAFDGNNDWYNGQGLVGMEQGGLQTDWGFGLSGGDDGVGGAPQEMVAGLGGTAGANTGDRATDGSRSYLTGGPIIATVTRTGSTVTLYFNGALDGQRTDISAQPRNTNTGFALGAMANAGGRNYLGDIAEVRIDNAALSGYDNARLLQHSADTYGTTSTYSDVVASDGATHLYKLDESSNAQPAVDSIGSNNGTYVNGPTVGQPTSVISGGHSVAFNGASQQHIDVANDTAANFSLELWMNTTTLGINDGPNAYTGSGLLWADVPGVANDFVLGLNGDHITFFDGSSNANTSAAGVDVVDGMWHHVVVTRDSAGGSTGVKIYIDGVLVATGVAGTAALTDKPTISIGGNVGDNRYYTGLLDNVAIYNSVLSPTQIALHAGFAVPAPAALPAGLMLLGSIAAVRRRPGRARRA